jgi:hypothetical protein
VVIFWDITENVARKISVIVVGTQALNNGIKIFAYETA